MPNKENNNKKVTSKQVVAIAGIAILLLMYLITLFAAIFDKSASGRLFMSSMLATVFIPFLIWIYTWLFGKLTGRRTFADLSVNNDTEEIETTADDQTEK